MIMESIFWGAILRISQAAITASPFILTGLFVAGILRRLLGHQKTRILFGGGSSRSLFVAWLIGMLLPVCSLGVIPVIRQMKKSSISGGTILAFALAAPLFNPLSLLYGLTLSKPATIFIFSLLSLVVITTAGVIWDKFCQGPHEDNNVEAEIPAGASRMLAVLVHAAREMGGASLGYMIFGLLGAGLLSTMLPIGSLQSDMGHDNPMAPLIMTAVALPAYASPMTAMGQLGSMFQHGNSIGAAFILLTFGAGMNLGLFWWMFRSYGLRSTLIWISILLAVVLILSYAIERPLYPNDAEPANHTHAFDIYCQPFEKGSADLPATVWRKLKQDTQPYERVSLEIVGILLFSGVALNLFDRSQRLENWLGRSNSMGAQSRLNFNVPGPVLGLVALITIVALSIVGCFAYYPNEKECLEEMRIARVEAFTGAISGNHNQVARWIPICEDWLRRLQVGVYLRNWKLSDYHRARARIFQQYLELVEHEVEEDENDHVRKLVSKANISAVRLNTAFLEEN
jgi:hypothetical protein